MLEKKTFILIILGLFLITSFNPVFSQEVKTEREWTILVYSVTGSMMTSSVIEDMNEMETIGSSAKIEILMQLDVNDRHVKRYRIHKDDDLKIVTSPVVEHLGDKDPGIWQTLHNFVNWGIKRAPSKRVMVIVQGCTGSLGYGEPIKNKVPTLKQLMTVGEYISGKESDKKKRERAKLARDYKKMRENGARYMGIRQMGFAIQAISEDLGRPIDLFVCDDSCDLSIEKFAEHKEYVSHWIGSVGFLPSDNLPYERIMKFLDAKPEASLDSICKGFVEAFKIHYTPYCSYPFGFGATLTAVNLQKSDKLLDAMKELGVILTKLTRKSSPNRFRILDIRKSTLNYISGDNLDLYQLCKKLASSTLPDENLQGVCEKITNIMEEFKIAHCGDGRYYKNASGVSATITTWLCPYDYQKYKLLKWSSMSSWLKFLKFLGKEF